MKKIINDPHQVVDETISGILKAYPNHLRMTGESQRALVRELFGEIVLPVNPHLPYISPGSPDTADGREGDRILDRDGASELKT